MKRYEITKYVVAKNIKEALKLEKDVEVEDICVEEELGEENRIGFHGDR